MSAPAVDARALPVRVTEKDFMETFRATFRIGHWRGWHQRYSPGSDYGYPDWTLVHEARCRLALVELKTDAGRLGPKQRAAFLAFLPLAEAGKVELYVFRPRDRDDYTRVLLADAPPERGWMLRRLEPDVFGKEIAR